MEPSTEITTTPTGSDTIGVGNVRGIVPATPPSSSDDGQSVTCAAGDTLDMATAEHEEAREQVSVPTSSGTMAGQFASYLWNRPLVYARVRTILLS